MAGGLCPWIWTAGCWRCDSEMVVGVGGIGGREESDLKRWGWNGLGRSIRTSRGRLRPWAGGEVSSVG